MTQFALPWVRQGELLPWDIGNVERGARISPETPRPFLVFDAHNAVWTIVRRMSQTAPRLLRPILQLEARRIKHYEGWMVRSFDQTLAVSEPDRLTLLEASQAVGTRSNNGRGIQPGRRAPRISVVPIAVDTTQLERIPRPAGSTNILTMGTLHYPPNADGIRWFLTEVYPRILEAVPQATLTIVGRNPPEDFFKLARRFSDTVEVTGHVPDLEPYLKRAAVFVVPVRSGGGMRVRILEGFARAMPTITTSVGLEGIDAVPGADILVADNPDEFASHVVDVIRDPELQKSLAANGRRLVESRYDWRVALRALDGVYAVA
jgi:glycosyltransferase involved in cell wall biosynthesis